MKRKLVSAFHAMNTYKGLLILWFVIGTITMILGDISRISYACVWSLLMMEYAIAAGKEK